MSIAFTNDNVKLGVGDSINEAGYGGAVGNGTR